MNIKLELFCGHRVLHITLDDAEIIAFDHLLNRALNTMSPEAAKPWLELEARIDQFIKDQKLKKVQAAIQGDQLRISAPSRDELQTTIRLLKAQDFGCESFFSASAASSGTC